MNKTDSVIYQRPHYYRGQLLLEDDFRAEQNYHVDARRRHNLHVHGSGVVQGLEVTRKTGNSITINAGYAIEDSGQEVFLDQSKEVDLGEFGPNDKIRVSLKYEEAGDDAEKQIRRECLAVIMATRVSEGSSGLTLATVTLDGKAKIGEDSIKNSQKTYGRIPAPGPITSEPLAANLKKGWLRIPPRPDPLVNVPKELGLAEKPPGFRVGATTALSPDSKNAGEKDRGAAGTISIPIPPGVIQVTRLRIAGEENEGEIYLAFFRGTWDKDKKAHHRDELAIKTISTRGPFIETIEIKDATLDPEWQTLSLRLIGTRRTQISLVAVEFVS